MLPALLAREVGLRAIPSTQAFISSLTARPFALSNHLLFQDSAHVLHALQLDLALNRYLLGGGAGGTVLVYDTAEGPDVSQPRAPIVRAVHGSSETVVRSVAWHAEDCGLFVTGASDGTVWLWDAERCCAAAKLSVRGAVSGTCFAIGAAVIAVAFASPHPSQPPQLRLWDVRQGPIAAHTFTLPAQPTALLAPSHAPFLLVGTASGHLLSLDPRRPLLPLAFSETGVHSGPAFVCTSLSTACIPFID